MLINSINKLLTENDQQQQQQQHDDVYPHHSFIHSFIHSFLTILHPFANS